MDETTLVVLIFTTYFLWDILHDVLMLRPTHPIRAAVVQTSASLASIGLAVLVWWNYRTLAVPNHVASVVFADLALISLLFGFRALKGLEIPLNRMLGANVETKDRDYNWRLWLVVCGVVLIFALTAMNLCQPTQAKDVVPEAVRSSIPRVIKTIFVDGEDLLLVLEGDLAFRDMIDTKVEAAETSSLVYVHPISGIRKGGTV